MSAVDDIVLEEALVQKPMSFALLRRLFAWARPYRPYLLINLAGTALAVGSQLAGPKLIQLGIDHYLTHITSSSARPVRHLRHQRALSRESPARLGV